MSESGRTFRIDSPKPATHHIVFLPGNPGCIGYYEAFLAHLAQLLQDADSSSSVSVYGLSYRNFSGESLGPALNLYETIEHAESVVAEYVAESAKQNLLENPESKDEPIKVILVGHSLGSWIGLEMIRRWRERELEREKNGSTPGPMRIVGFAGLWATPVGIAQSPSGRKIAVAFKIPHIVSILSAITAFIVALLPTQVFLRLIQSITGFPNDAASTTAEFARSPHGIRQSLTLVADELKYIAEDRWNEDIWGAATPAPGPPRPKIAFVFGKVDHYVKSEIRDELIKSRGRGEGKEEEWRPIMLVDDTDAPHAFCIRHSKYAAQKALPLILNML